MWLSLANGAEEYIVVVALVNFGAAVRQLRRATPPPDGAELCKREEIVAHVIVVESCLHDAHPFGSEQTRRGGERTVAWTHVICRKLCKSRRLPTAVINSTKMTDIMAFHAVCMHFDISQFTPCSLVLIY